MSTKAATAVQLIVIFCRHKDEVLGSIVPLHAIEMMNVFVSAQSATDLLLDHVSMLHDTGAVFARGFFVRAYGIRHVLVEDVAAALRTERLVSKTLVLSFGDPGVPDEFNAALSAAQCDSGFHIPMVTDFDPIDQEAP